MPTRLCAMKRAACEAKESGRNTNQLSAVEEAGDGGLRFHEETESLPWRVIDWSAVMVGLCWLLFRMKKYAAGRGVPCDARRGDRRRVSGGGDVQNVSPRPRTSATDVPVPSDSAAT